MGLVKIKFDSNQDYQIKAVDAILNALEGIDKDIVQTGFQELSFNQLEADYIVSNADELFEFREDILLDNINKVRKENNLELKAQLGLDDFNDGDTLPFIQNQSMLVRYPQFVINMETGTGKTYVYLRTIYSLHEKYGFRKFVIVVPSVAIYEGAISTFEATRTHFDILFPGTVPNSILKYDGDSVQVCKRFGVNNAVEIILMTIDSFNKTGGKGNTIFKQTEKIRTGKLPVQYMQETRPILILDEVQNYKTETARRALRTLNPLFSIGYSATPDKVSGIELYRLSSYEASQMNLVKRIDVWGVEENQVTTQKEDYFKIVKIRNAASVCVELKVKHNNSTLLEEIDVKCSELFKNKSSNDAYGNLAIENINAKDGFVDLNNGLRYYANEQSCAALSREVVFRNMIRQTILQHKRKQKEIDSHGYKMKVLSLFFVDKVSSYKAYDDKSVSKIFDEEFDKIKAFVPEWKDLKGCDVREGYFAKKKADKSSAEVEIDTPYELDDKNKDDKKAEKIAYELIMKGKERLLSKDEKVCFIFAHSALREGWDNPNVFQICALREITSENSRRQTIGRGLRLPVSYENGERIRDRNINRLTVFANESYADFADKLQKEYQQEGIMKSPEITNARHYTEVRRTNRYDSDDFISIWRAVNKSTDYKINIKTDELVNEIAVAVNNAKFEDPKIIWTKGEPTMKKFELKLIDVSDDGQAKFQISIKDSGQQNLFGDTGSTLILKKGDKIERKVNSDIKECREIANLKVDDIVYNTDNPDKSHILFSKIDQPLYKGKSIVHEMIARKCLSAASSSDIEYPDICKGNIIERITKEVSLTRKTVYEILNRINREKLGRFMRNPEGWTNQFIAIVKGKFADHIAKNIEYILADSSLVNDRAVLFPEVQRISSSELKDIVNKGRSVYERIQVDSEVEKNFVSRLDDVDEAGSSVRLFFKFSPKYKIRIPKIIGNYNPDWAIVRDVDGKTVLNLVRETKGSEDIKALPHTNEGRKIVCAQKHFMATGVDYRFVDDGDYKWYEKCDEEYDNIL